MYPPPVKAQICSPFHCCGTMPSRRSTTGFGMIRPVLTDTRTLSPSSVYFHSIWVGFLGEEDQSIRTGVHSHDLDPNEGYECFTNICLREFWKWRVQFNKHWSWKCIFPTHFSDLSVFFLQLWLLCEQNISTAHLCEQTMNLLINASLFTVPVWGVNKGNIAKQNGTFTGNVGATIISCFSNVPVMLKQKHKREETHRYL